MLSRGPLSRDLLNGDPLGSSVCGIFQARILERLSLSSSRSNPQFLHHLHCKWVLYQLNRREARWAGISSVSSTLSSHFASYQPRPPALFFFFFKQTADLFLGNSHLLGVLGVFLFFCAAVIIWVGANPSFGSIAAHSLMWENQHNHSPCWHSHELKSEQQPKAKSITMYIYSGHSDWLMLV